MNQEVGLRERKKAQQREHIADIAAGLFAERGYDAVAVSDVARAADVSEQTVYNYYPAKNDLVLDRADEFRDLYGHAVRERPRRTSPASAMQTLVADDIERFRVGDSALARGEFPAQCLTSGLLRRFALELREQQADAVAAAIRETDPRIPALVVRAHAAALISVVQSITDQIGRCVLDGTPPDAVVKMMTHDARVAFEDLDRTFHTITVLPKGQ